VEKDAIINRGLYVRKETNSDEWYEIRQLIATTFGELFEAKIKDEAELLVRDLLPKLVPEVQVGHGSHKPIAGQPTFLLHLTAQPGTHVDKVEVIVVLRGVEFKGSGDQWSYELSLPNPPARIGNSQNKFIATVQWSASDQPVTSATPVQEFFFSYVAIFYPKT
jgi:hypothetical protein